MTDAGPRAQAPLEDGLALLEEQREAMLARDPARLEAANVRLSAWIAACRQDGQAPGASADTRSPALPATPATPGSPILRALQTALGANARLAQRSSMQAARAFDALVRPEAAPYTDEGRTPARAPRRGVVSA